MRLPRQCAHWLAMTSIIEGALRLAMTVEGQGDNCQLSIVHCQLKKSRQLTALFVYAR